MIPRVNITFSEGGARRCWQFRGSQEVEPSSDEERNFLLEVGLTNEATPEFGAVGISMEYRISQFRHCLGGGHSDSKGCGSADYAASMWRGQQNGVVLEGEDQVKFEVPHYCDDCLEVIRNAYLWDLAEVF